MGFTRQYKDLKQEGHSPGAAFGLVASYIAYQGSIEDLREVRDQYYADIIENCEKISSDIKGITKETKKIVEESNNESITGPVSKSTAI